MKILVTGADGFVGRYLVSRLSGQGNAVVAAMGPSRGSRSSIADIPNGDVLYDSFDLSNIVSIQELVSKHLPDQIYHLAGIAVSHGVDSKTYWTINALATRWLAEAFFHARGTEGKFLFVSSAAVYGTSEGSGLLNERTGIHPTSDYGGSKAAAEALLWPLVAKGMNLVMARPFNHSGPGQKPGFVCPDMIIRLRDLVRSSNGHTPLKYAVYSPNSVRDFMDVRDVVVAYELIMQHFGAGEVVNVSSGSGVAVRELANILIRYSKESFQANLALEEVKGAGCTALVGDCSLLKGRTGWEPCIPLEIMLKDLWSEYA